MISKLNITYLKSLFSKEKVAANKINELVDAFNTTIDTTTASNGLTKDVNDVQLGGTLTSDTTILNGGKNFALSGKLIEFTTDNQSYTEGWMYLGATESQFGYNSNWLDVNNTWAALRTGANEILGVDTTLGIKIKYGNVGVAYLKTTNINVDRNFELPNTSGTIALTSDIVTTTASNGLTKTGNDVVLGGALTANTTISNGSKNFSLSGKQIEFTTDDNAYLEAWAYFTASQMQIGYGGRYLDFYSTYAKMIINGSELLFPEGVNGEVLVSTATAAGTIVADKTITINVGGVLYKIPAVLA